MKLSSLFLLSLTFCLIISACNNPNKTIEEKRLNASDLAKGDKVDNLTISKIYIYDDFLDIKFADEIEIEGSMGFELSPTGITIDYQLLKSKIINNENTIDFSEYKTIYILNYEEIAKYIPLEWRATSTTDEWQLKDDMNRKINLKLKIKDIAFTNDGPFSFTANMSELISFNGNENPVPVINDEIKNTQAKLNLIALSTDGAWYYFIDENENEIRFFDDGNQQVHNFFDDIELNTSDHKFKKKWLLIEYKNLYDKSTGEYAFRAVDVLTSVTYAENKK
jgi:hypothetical protein